MRLTAQEIMVLAEFVGLLPDRYILDSEELKSEITIVEDAGEHVAYFTKYPDEGAIKLG